MEEGPPPPEDLVAPHTGGPHKRLRSDSGSSISGESSRSFRTLTSDDLEYVHENGRTYGNDTYYLPCVYKPNKDYVEQDRLFLLHQICVHALQGRLTTTRLLPSTRRILDLGTGPGYWAAAMARQYPHAEVVGIDMTEWDIDSDARVTWELDDLDVWGREIDGDDLIARLAHLDLTTFPNYRKPIESPKKTKAPAEPAQSSGQAQASDDSLSIDLSTLMPQPEPGWHFSDSFELIHMRNMTGAFTHWEEVYAEIYKNLSPGGWIEVADWDLGNLQDIVGRSGEGGILDGDSVKLPMPTLSKLYAGIMEASFKSGRPLGRYYMNPSYLEEAGFKDIQTTNVNVPVGQWVEDEAQRPIGKMMYVLGMELLEPLCLRLLTQWGSKDRVWTAEEVRADCETARKEIADWLKRSERGEVEGWCASFKWIIGQKSWHAEKVLAACVVVTCPPLPIPSRAQIQFLAEPFHRMFFLDNLSIGYPHAQVERVPVPWLFVYAGAVPLAMLVTWALLVRPGSHKAHVTILGWFISMLLTMFITDVIKNAVGRPRPDLVARCKPAPGTPAHQLVTYEVCTETDHHILHDGWRSFPSGHSSFSFSGLGYLALFIAGQCHVYRPRAGLARVLLALAPLLGAALIAISRCEDYRHDVYDVSVGSVLGMAVAHYTYRRYYPPLRNRQCATPYPSPADEKGWAKVKGDEEALRGVADFELDEFSEDEERESRPLNGRR
ncbi:acid phosphatase/Vanadium-dependent haloperoxidase [Decorospora gaudefroyi]|uniref:Acid phosphatase/Vanadium-dependent haloperoxidase n=1 Tax=Decorospora gaudefroyi TaxID=184978 RepID=A0A6A5K8N1_9PLEO|nr:acid phosphatase/Vanadium-dependent haloperoxidase [Decorospora gaudefroyi]